MTSDAARMIEVLAPVVRASREQQQLNPRLADVRGKVVGLLNNSDHSRAFFASLERALREKAGVAGVVVVSKSSPTVSASPEQIAELAQACDLAFTGVAD